MSRASSSARNGRGGRGAPANKKQISTEDQRFLESALAALPEGPAAEGTGFADDLQRFSYHSNPYMRTFTKVLWSGFALSRGQVLECHTRFKQAHRDATMSNIDQVTVRALDDAASCLDAALAPDGSVSLFLLELRSKTMQRIWARVCETSMMPPPSFRKIYGEEQEMTAEEMDAAEAAELAALLHDPEDLAEMAGTPEAVESATEEGAESTPAQASAANDETSGEAAASDGTTGNDADADTKESQAGPAAFSLSASRTGTAEESAELLLAAASELLRELRGRAPSGQLKVSLRIEGVGQSGEKSRGRRRRRRR